MRAMKCALSNYSTLPMGVLSVFSELRISAASSRSFYCIFTTRGEICSRYFILPHCRRSECEIFEDVRVCVFCLISFSELFGIFTITIYRQTEESIRNCCIFWADTKKAHHRRLREERQTGEAIRFTADR